MNEAYLKKQFKDKMRELMPGVVVVRHEDKFSAGIPDMSVTWKGTTSWIEVKYSRGGRRSRPTALQEQALHALARAGAPTFLLEYEEMKHKGETGTCKAAMLYKVNADGSLTEYFHVVGGFNHVDLAERIKAVHNERKV